MLFEDVSAQCPHCFEEVSIPIDPGGGEEQDTYIDCEVCCRSIWVRASWDENASEYHVTLERG
jgi:hypothetical protein